MKINLVFYISFVIVFAFLLLGILLLKNRIKARRINMTDWMSMTNKERRNHFSLQRLSSMKRKRGLIKNIRKEYKRIEDSS